ncbi:glycerophosphoryl diester phosphodiesterase membrane domain-containing protein [Streptomyces sp. TS71-3]|uniref:glycerophosphoryl diester phosphodiesterase membrane domain-containing protein n=1 Tax=Streptomyces sp. TS71-3 TaxID=2733862 RepID=UPI001B030471|nr:glycerophosphoryl diester phosphodiesterase membrane domain-containing protein [Streptomyces sp. TS71-3]GHJ36413.1 hypothetical protein Sm713_20220 [Streptomyces sp. TS71-3]
MNDTPGWASPGSSPSERPAPSDGAPGQDPRQEPTDEQQKAPAGGQPPQPPVQGTPQPPAQGAAPPLPGWSKQQPPPGPWSTPGGQPPPPPPPPGSGPGWGAPGSGGGAPGGPGGAPGWGGQGPGTPGGPGWGGPGGPGWGGWQGRPAAAKPGIIPLRPLGVGEILDGAVSMMRTYWRTVLGISLSVAVLVQVALVVVQGTVLNDTAESTALNDRTASLSELAHAMRGVLVSSGVVLLVSLLGTIIATALLTTVTSRAVLGRPVTIAEAWRDARPQVPRLFGLTFLLPLIVMAIVAVGMLPGVLIAVATDADAGLPVAVLGGLVAGVVALWLAIRFALASPALMLERQGVFKSLSRSAKLVKGSWWRVLGIQLLAAIISNIVSSIILIPFTLVAEAVGGGGDSGGLLGGTAGAHGWTYLIISGVGSIVGSMLTFPITAGVAVLLYIDQRIRREALDLELGRAAGLQGPGSDAPGPVPGG